MGLTKRQANLYPTLASLSNIKYDNKSDYYYMIGKEKESIYVRIVFYDLVDAFKFKHDFWYYQRNQKIPELPNEQISALHRLSMEARGMIPKETIKEAMKTKIK